MTHKHLLQALRSLFELQKSGKLALYLVRLCLVTHKNELLFLIPCGTIICSMLYHKNTLCMR